MNSSDEKMNGHANIGRQLRRLAASETNRRHLLELPLFQVNRDLPEDLDMLLRERDPAETAPARR